MKTEKSISLFVQSLFAKNPVFSMGLGLCVGIMTEPDARRAFFIGLFSSVALVLTSMMASVMKKVLPRQTRIPSLVLIISGTLTLIRFMLKSYFPVFESGVSDYYLLLACSCLVLGHTENYAFSHSIKSTAINAIGVGLGYTFTLVLMALLREILGCGTIFGKNIIIGNLKPMYIFAMAPGALFLAGCICAFVNWATHRREEGGK